MGPTIILILQMKELRLREESGFHKTTHLVDGGARMPSQTA